MARIENSNPAHSGGPDAENLVLVKVSFGPETFDSEIFRRLNVRGEDVHRLLRFTSRTSR